MDYEYFRVEESEQFSFFRIPKALFTEKEFEGLSTDAKLLYGILAGWMLMAMCISSTR